MQQDQPPIKESASNRLAAALRDGLLALAVFALVVWFLYNGLTGIVTRHLDSNNEIGVRWIPKPLNGWRAVVAGCSFVCMALAIPSVLASHRRIAGRVPHWVHASKWWLVPMWAILYFVTAL